MNTMLEQRRTKREHNFFDDLPENFTIDILVRLPVETLCCLRFVCKSWYEIINSPDFRNTHLHRSLDTTARGLIFLTPDKNYIKYMEIKDGKSTIKEYNNTSFNGKIVATCNGLIVLERNPNTGLILHNPVTREDEDIPLGTIISSSQRDVYGLAFCHVSRRYKLLHLFTKDAKLRNLGCEIMDVGSGGSWRAVVDVPPANYFSLLQNPIFAMGSLHWIQNVVDHGLCIVSMPLDDEKFKTRAIPGPRDSSFDFSVFAMGEFLGFASRLARANRQIGVWILRGECGWEMKYNIDVASGLLGVGLDTLLCYGGGVNGYAFIFQCVEDGCLYAYDDRHSQLLRKIEDNTDSVADTTWRRIFPHVNSLVSWRS